RSAQSIGRRSNDGFWNLTDRIHPVTSAARSDEHRGARQNDPDLAVMTGEGQVVQLRVRPEHDALRERIDRAGIVERLREAHAGAIVAADIAIPRGAIVADADRIATG